MIESSESLPLSAAQQLRRDCAVVFGVDETRMIGRSRLQPIVRARQAACYVIKAKFPELSYPAIGRFMGGRDHSTIIHAIRAVTERLERDPALSGKVRALIGPRRAGKHYDAHVVQWQAWSAARAAMDAVAADHAALLTELGEFVETPTTWCAQCDRAVTQGELRGCKARLCSLRPPGLAIVSVRVPA